MILRRESYVDIVSLQTTVPSEQLVGLQSWAQQHIHNRAHSGCHADEHTANRECNKTASSLVKHCWLFVRVISLLPFSLPHHFLPLPPSYNLTRLFYLEDNCFTVLCWFLPPTAWISRVYPPLETLANSPPLEVSKGQWAELPVPVSQRATGSLLTHRSVHMSAHPPDPSHRLLPLPRPKSSLRLCLSSCPEALFKQLACESNLDVHRQKNG